MTQRVFTSDDQLAFAELSGDYNPLHLDALHARRLLFGRRVVHGLHALLWSLDNHLKSHRQPLELQTVKANFQAGIGVGQTAGCLVMRQDENLVAIQLEADGTPAARFEITWGPLRHTSSGTLPKISSEPDICRERFLDEVAVAAGSIALYFDGDLGGRLFPNLLRLLPPMQLAAVLATTRLVGMECPGRHSIYASLQLAFSSGNNGASNLYYHVADCNRPLALVALDVNAPGVKGQVKAFLRPKPQRQAAFTDVCRQVESEEFSTQQALIVGGSRGLGEVSAKILAAGGAQVILTYHRGQEDAQRIIEEMVARGAKATCLALDVLEPSQDLAHRLANRCRPLYLYYFATPYIFGAANGKFSSRRFAAFSAYYVTGFLRTIQAVADSTSGLKKVFYPSSAAIDELPLDMGEYAAAKMAGEVLCDFLQKAYQKLPIYKPRLPRIATDQTVSLLPVINQDPVPVLLRKLRYFKQI